jgi:hypothetical protein
VVPKERKIFKNSINNSSNVRQSHSTIAQTRTNITY